MRTRAVGRVGATEIVIALVAAAVAAIASIGADTRWLAALGGSIVSRGAIPRGVPYAGAPSHDWPNVPVAAELAFHWLAGLGDRGFLLAQVVAVAVAFTLLAVDMRRSDAEDESRAIVLLVVAVGAAPALFFVRVQLFSLVLFPLLALLLRAEARRPSKRIWLAPVLLAAWSNLHGAVLVGLAVAIAYLVFARARDHLAEAAALAVVSVLSVCATPALERTPAYYAGVLHNEAARRGVGLWAPLSPTAPLDVVLVVAAVALVGLALRKKPQLWEIVALVGLAVLAVKTSRSGVWLLFFAAPPAAAALDLRRTVPQAVAVVTSALLCVVAVYEIGRGPQGVDVSDRLVRVTLRQAAGTPVLAEARLSERIALAGGRVWMSNPLDAFPRRDQALYLDWLDGRARGMPAFAHAPRVVLVRRGGPAERLTRMNGRFRLVATDAYAALYARRR